METASCHLVLRVTPNGEVDPASLAETPKMLQPIIPLPVTGGSLGLADPVPTNRPSGARAILPVAGGAHVMTAGTDCTVRLWDRLRPESSYVVCGPTCLSPAGIPLKPKYNSRVISKVRILQEIPTYSLDLLSAKPKVQGSSSSSSSSESQKKLSNSEKLLRAAARDNGGCHRDCVTAMDWAFSGEHDLLITGGRDGTVKVWR